MTPRQYNEMMRQAEVLEQDKKNRLFHTLWEQFRTENPNTVGSFQEQYIAFNWLFNELTKLSNEK